jgi:phosphoribosylformylglycinamidine synthase
VLGVVDDVRRRVPMGFAASGDVVFVLGVTRDELGGSEWAHHVHGHLGGLPPQVDLAAEKALASVMSSLVGVASAAHDVSDGGLAQALAEMALRRGVGVQVALDSDPFVALFSESVARAVVAVPPDQVTDLETAGATYGVPVTRLGATGGAALIVEGLFDVPLDELRAAHTRTLPVLFG